MKTLNNTKLIEKYKFLSNKEYKLISMDNFARFVIKIHRRFSCSHDCLSFNYLRVSIFVSAPKYRFLQPLTDKVKLKLTYWKGKSLSMMHQIHLVNTVITGFLAYNSFNMYKWPISLLNQVK